MIHSLKTRKLKIVNLKRVLHTRRRKLLAVSLAILILATSLQIFLFNREVRADWSPTHTRWEKRKQLTVTNNSTDSLAADTTITITVNTKELYDARKLQADCDDLRVIYQPNSTTFTELTRHLVFPSGETCLTSETTKVYFDLQAALAAGASSTNYYMYYSNGSASSPPSTDNTFDIGSKDALLVCPFDGSTTCAAGETPSTESGAIRYSGAKSAVEFDGIDHISVPAPSPSDGTIEFWMKREWNYEGTGSHIFNKYDSAPLDGLLAHIAGGQLKFRYNYADTVNTPLTNIPQSTWVHIALTFGSGGLELFVDGVSRDTDANTNGLDDRSDATFYIGRASSSTTDSGFVGQLDDFRISNVVRYTSNFTPQTSPFVRDENTELLLHFDENGDDSRNTGKAIDDSGNGNDGTITGAKYVAGLVGVDGSPTPGVKEGKIPGVSYAGQEGIFIEEATSNKITNPSFENTNFDQDWTSAVNVQSDTVTFDMANSSLTDTITPVDIDRSILLFGASFNDAEPNCSGVGGTLTNATTITFQKGPNVCSGNFVIQWYVAELPRGVSVQRGSQALSNSSTTVNVTINSVDTTKAFPIINQRYEGSFEGTYSDDDYIKAKITSSTNLELSCNKPGGCKIDKFIEWQVVEYQNATVQTGDVSFGTGDSSLTDTLSPSVDTTKSWLLFTNKSDAGTGSNIGQKMFRGVITNSTTLTFDRDSTGQATDLTWYLVEFTDATNVQGGTENFGTGDTEKNVVITSVDRTRSVAAAGGRYHKGGKTPYSANDNPGVSSVTLDLDADTNLELIRGVTGSTTADIGWFVTEFASTLNDNLTVTSETAAPFYKFGSSSAKAVADASAISGDSNMFTHEVNPGNTNTHTFSAFVYDGTTGNVGGTIDNTVARIVWEGVSQAGTTYTDIGGGWWRLSYSTATTNSANEYGIEAQVSKTVYIDGVQLEEKSVTTTYTDGALGTGYSWSGTANDSTSSKPGTNNIYTSSGNFSSSEGSISMWFKQTDDTNTYLFNIGAGSSNSIRKNSDKIQLSNWGSCSTIADTTNVTLGNWYHVVATWSNTTGNCELYVNASSKGTSNTFSTFTPKTNFAVCGYYETSVGDPDTNQCNGSISDLRIFDDDLTSAEVTDLYQAGLVSHQQGIEVDRYDSNKGQNPVAVWHFDESSGTTAYDSSIYENDLTISGATQEVGPLGGPTSSTRQVRNLKFDGVNDYASRTWDRDFNFGTGSFSIGGWFRHPSTITGTDTILARYGSAGYKVYMNSSGYVCFGIDDDSTWTPADSACSTTSYADSNWYHFEAVKNGTTDIKLYINGNEVASVSSLNATSSLNSSAPLYVGIDSDGTGNPWDGFLDEIVIYPYARDASQVKEDFLGSQTAQVYGASSEDFLTEGLVGYWKMDDAGVDAEGEISTDSSGNGNDGTLFGDDGTGDNGTGMDCTVAGKFDTGCDFDGTDDYVDAGSDPELDNLGPTTIALWVKPASQAGAVMVGKNSNWELSIDATTEIRFRLGTDGGLMTTDSNSVIVADEWQFITATWDGSISSESDRTNVRLYHNGIDAGYKSRNPGSGNLTGNGGSNLTFGSRGGINNFYDGTVDSIRIYNRALTPSEVSVLYNWAPGPVLYLPFNDGAGSTAYDRSGNENNASPVDEVEWVQGKYGKGFEYGGAFSELQVSNDSTLQLSNDITLEAWVYPKSKSDEQILQKGFAGSEDYAFRLENNLVFIYYDDISAEHRYLTDSDPFTTLNQWYNVALTYTYGTGSSMQMYVDGKPVSGSWTTGNGNSTLTPNSTQLYIGERNGGFAQFDGKLDEIKIYNYARTQTQIIEDMNAGHPVGGSPLPSQIGYWSFDEQQGQTAYDRGNGGNDGTLGSSSGSDTNDPTWKLVNNCKVNGCLDFDGLDNYVDYSSYTLLNGASEATFSYWFNGADVAGSDTSIALWPGTANKQFLIYHLSDESIRVFVPTAGGDVNTYGSTSASTIPISGLTFVTVVYDGSLSASNRLKVYVDGLEYSLTITGTIPTTLTDSITPDLIIGSVAGSSNFFDGQLDEVKIYNVALTSDQLRADMNQGSASTLGATDYGQDISGGAGNPPVGYWKMNEGVDNTCAGGTNDICDYSENSNDGANNGGPTWLTSARCKYGKCLDFDGSDDYIEIGSSLKVDNSSQGVISAWIYAKSTTNEMAIFNYGGAAASSAGEFTFFIDDGGAAGQLAIREGPDGSGTTTTRSGSGNTISTNAWQHVVLASDETQYEFYINGKLLASTGNGDWLSDVGNLQETDRTNIGRRWRNGGWSSSFDGGIDEVKIYNYARSSAQIAWDYNRGAPIGYWKLDECTGATAYDSSPNSDGGFNGNNGTITIGGSGTNTSAGTCSSGDTTEAWYNGRIGKRNASLDFDGSDDVISLASPALLDDLPDNDFSVTGWLYSTDTIDYQDILVIQKQSAITDGWRIKIKNGNLSPQLWRMETNVQYDTTDANKVTAGVGPVNSWVHFASVFDSSTKSIRMWLNGVEPGYSGTNTNGSGTYQTDASNNLIISENDAGNEEFTGQIDEVKIFNYALTANQIKQIYNDGAVRFGP